MECTLLKEKMIASNKDTVVTTDLRWCKVEARFINRNIDGDNVSFSMCQLTCNFIFECKYLGMFSVKLASMGMMKKLGYDRSWVLSVTFIASWPIQPSLDPHQKTGAHLEDEQLHDNDHFHYTPSILLFLQEDKGERIISWWYNILEVFLLAGKVGFIVNIGASGMFAHSLPDIALLVKEKREVCGWDEKIINQNLC